MDEGGCSRGFCSENLRSLSGRDNCTRLELPECTIDKREFSLMGRWQVPGRAWEEADFSPTNDFQDGLMDATEWELAHFGARAAGTKKNE